MARWSITDLFSSILFSWMLNEEGGKSETMRDPTYRGVVVLIYGPQKV